MRNKKRMEIIGLLYKKNIMYIQMNFGIEIIMV